MAVRDPHRDVRYHGRLGFTSQQRELLQFSEGRVRAAVVDWPRAPTIAGSRHPGATA
jgi:hypothetical protein